jgi:hypothetical protein
MLPIPLIGVLERLGELADPIGDQPFQLGDELHHDLATALYVSPHPLRWTPPRWEARHWIETSLAQFTPAEREEQIAAEAGEWPQETAARMSTALRVVARTYRLPLSRRRAYGFRPYDLPRSGGPTLRLVGGRR